jgi:Tfp pilus assembly protein PilO
VVVFVGLVYLALFPAYQCYAGMKQQLDDAQSRVVTSRIVANSLGSEKTKLSQAQQDYDKYSKMFATEMRDGSNVILLGLKAASSDVQIMQITPGNIVTMPNYLELPLEIQAQGDYPNIQTFCTDIERLPNLTYVRGLTIATVPPSQNAAGGSSLVSADLKVIIFSAKTPQERIGMEAIRSWAIGRSNVFAPAGGAAGASSSVTQPAPTQPALPSYITETPGP